MQTDRGTKQFFLVYLTRKSEEFKNHSVYRVSRDERPKFHERIMRKNNNMFLSDFHLFSSYSVITNKQNCKH
jgi:hypothetical protein